MWGKKKDKDYKPLGYLNDMSPEQQECFNQFKQWIQMNNATSNPWHTDSFLLKFCRARKFELDKVILMFSNYMEYRKTEQIDDIVYSFKFEQKEACQPYYPRGYCGVDKIGRPVYIERSGMIDPTKIWENVDADTLWRSYY